MRRNATKIKHPIAYEFYHYVLGPRNDPGAPAEIFKPHFQLPVFSFRGSARLAGAMRPTQPPQIYFRQQRGIQGLGGIQAGQIISQPLIDPSTLGD